ncbi:MAG: transporter substrate-binding domain-containing protein, partial [Deltaproteobacteria bacterium]|nr:transporter substrate-binding domain-containing protein [Deltaproteobacteria bacterium]
MANFWISLCLRFKRLLFILLVTIIALGPVFCAADESHLQAKMPDKVTPPILPPQSIIQEKVVTKERPLPKKRLSTIIVDNYYPYTFLNQQGTPDGYSVDLIKAVSKVMGLEIDIHGGPWDQAIKALETGQIDLLPMMAYSQERDKLFDFSVPHTISYDAVFVLKKHSAIKSIKDLMGKRIIVMRDDAAHQYLVSKGLATTDRLVLTDSLPDALRLLAAGKGDAALMPKLVGLVNLKKLGLSNIEQSPVVIDDYTRPFSFSVRKGNKALLDRLSDGLSIVKATGEYDQIHSKWFGVVESSEKIMQSVIRYILLTIAAIGGVALFFVVWFLSIRKQVTLRTRELQQEIGERKKAEELLRESEEQLRMLVQTSPVAIAISDLEQNNVLVNKKFVELFGYTLEDIPSVEDWWLLAYPDEEYREAIKSEWNKRVDQAIICHGEIEPMEAKVRCRDGTNRDIEFRLSATGEKNFVTFTDLTDHRRAEEGRLAYLQFLEKLGLIDRAIRQASNVEQMLWDVIKTVYSIFDCDRVWLFYPGDPDSPTFKVPVEYTRPEYPGAAALNMELPMPLSMAQDIRECLASENPVTFTHHNER